jgi:hypothetical protein
LATALLFEWRRAEEALELSMATHNASAEILKMRLESGAGYAQWLTKGLRELRSGNTDEGYLLLDQLLLVLIRGVDPDGSSAGSVHAVNAYLAEVGDPWQR